MLGEDFEAGLWALKMALELISNVYKRQKVESMCTNSSPISVDNSFEWLCIKGRKETG